MINNILPSIFGSALAVIVLLAFQNDISELFGVSGSQPANISLIKDILTPLAVAFFGAISGALAAFKLQAKKEEIQEEKKELTHITMSLLAFESQFNHLGAIKRQSILPFAEAPLRFMAIRPNLGPDPATESIDLNMVPALVKLEKPDLIQKTRLAQTKYNSCINTLKERDKIRKIVEDQLEGAGIANLDNLSAIRIYQIVGPSLITYLYELTEDYIKLVDDTIIILDESMTELTTIMSEYSKKSGSTKIGYLLPDENKYLLDKTIDPQVTSIEHLYQIVGHATTQHE